MEKEFINVYIDNVVKKWEESQKQVLLLESHLQLNQQMITKLTENINDLTSQIERLEGELNKKKKKGVDTPSDTF